MRTIIPSYLKKGDTIGIASTARFVSPEDLKTTIELVENRGLKYKFSDNLFIQYHQLAGDEKTRLAGFQKMLDDDEIQAIWFARGGYGTVKVIDEINWEKYQKKPKWICGYSDYTVLFSNLFFNQNSASIHAIMPINIKANNKESLQSAVQFLDVLFGIKNTIKMPENIYTKKGNFEGKLMGGNLSVLYSLLGSSSYGETENCILFLEDLDEYLYHIDRMMMALKRAKKFDNLAGIIIGSFSDMRDNAIPFGKDAYQIISDILAPYNFPVYFDFPAGHSPKNFPLILGENYKMEEDVFWVID